MDSIPDNATRIKRFRELKVTLRTRRDRLLVGIDIDKAQHAAQIRFAHARILEAKLTIPNTQAGFATFWARLAAHRTATHVPEIVCAVEPTGTYHQALATFLEQQGATVVLVSPHVARRNRETRVANGVPRTRGTRERKITKIDSTEARAREGNSLSFGHWSGALP